MSTESDALTIDIDGWEGPLDLLLDLARRQKVDLKAISILALVDQYIAYIERAEALRLEIAADYLVMAAWLAYLKSALLLPKDEQEDPSPEELALRLQLRLQRLGAMREAAARLLARDRIGRDVFLRGAPEGLRIDRKNMWQCDWYSLVSAYALIKARGEPVVHMVRDRMVLTLDAALDRVSAMLGVRLDWMELRDFLPANADPLPSASAFARAASIALAGATCHSFANASPHGNASHSGGFIRATRPPSWSIETSNRSRPWIARSSSVSARNCARSCTFRPNRM